MTFEPKALDQLCSFLSHSIWQFCSIHSNFRQGGLNRQASGGSREASREPFLLWLNSWVICKPSLSLFKQFWQSQRLLFVFSLRLRFSFLYNEKSLGCHESWTPNVRREGIRVVQSMFSDHSPQIIPCESFSTPTHVVLI